MVLDNVLGQWAYSTRISRTDVYAMLIFLLHAFLTRPSCLCPNNEMHHELDAGDSLASLD
jgi:hypothetical protein